MIGMLAAIRESHGSKSRCVMYSKHELVNNVMQILHQISRQEKLMKIFILAHAARPYSFIVIKGVK